MSGVLEAGVYNTPVLIFDDARSSREYVGGLVSRLGFSVFSVGQADTAFSYIFRTDAPMLVLMRADMKNGESATFCELVRNTSIGYQPFIIGFAERFSDKAITQLMRAGIDNVFVGLNEHALLQQQINVALRHLSHQLSAGHENAQLRQQNHLLEQGLALTETALFEEDLMARTSVRLTPQSTGLNPFPLDVEQQETRLLSGIPEVIERQLSDSKRPATFKLLCTDNKRRWLEQTTLSIEFDEEEPVRRVTMVRDITAQRARERELNEQLALVDQLDRSLTEIVAASDIGIIELELESDRVSFNASTKRMLFSPATSTGDGHRVSLNRLLDNLEQPSIDCVRELIREVRDASTTVKSVVRVNSIDGRTHSLQFTFNQSSTDPNSISGSILDLTPHYALLADRDEALAQSKALFGQLERQDEERSRLFAIISHEIRTPLASLKMLAEQNNLAQKLAQGAEMTSLIDQSLQLLTDLRSVIHPEDREQPRPTEPTTLRQISEDALNVIQPLLSVEGFKLETNLDAFCESQYALDRHGLRRVLVNLLKNAAVHSGGDEIRLNISLASENEEVSVFLISIEDNGRGIPTDQVSTLFQPFMQGDTERDGSGLGLMIVKKLVSDMGGSIHYLPSQLGGARFLIELPAHSSEQLIASSTPADQPLKLDLANSRILYAEDNPTLRMLTENILGSFKPRKLVVAKDGSEALKEYTDTNGAFDLVITDIFMPNMSGYDLTEHLRKLGFGGKIIGLTAATLGEETDRLLQLGANHVIEKPLTKEKLL